MSIRKDIIDVKKICKILVDSGNEYLNAKDVAEAMGRI
jgi:hypothetical protein